MVLAAVQLAFITCDTASFGPGPPLACVCVILLFVEPEMVSHFLVPNLSPILNVFFGISLIQAFVVGEMK